MIGPSNPIISQTRLTVRQTSKSDASTVNVARESGCELSMRSVAAVGGNGATCADAIPKMIPISPYSFRVLNLQSKGQFG